MSDAIVLGHMLQADILAPDVVASTPTKTPKVKPFSKMPFAAELNSAQRDDGESIKGWLKGKRDVFMDELQEYFKSQGSAEPTGKSKMDYAEGALTVLHRAAPSAARDAALTLSPI